MKEELIVLRIVLLLLYVCEYKVCTSGIFWSNLLLSTQRNIVGITNLVWDCILGWLSVVYHFRVNVTFTSDLVSRIIMSGAYLLHYLK